MDLGTIPVHIVWWQKKASSVVLVGQEQIRVDAGDQGLEVVLAQALQQHRKMTIGGHAFESHEFPKLLLEGLCHTGLHQAKKLDVGS